MSEALNPNMPQGQTVAPVANPLGRMKAIYVAGLVCAVGLQFVSSLLEASMRWGNVTLTVVAAQATVAVLVPVILAIPAGLITAIGAIWSKRDRGNLFMRLHFYPTVLLTLMIVISRMAMLYVR